jgi:AcrR family transcriptional regulator
MGDFKKNKVKDGILQKSMKLFLATGYKGTSVKEITEAAGIAKGTLYWHFKSKNEILKGIFEKFDEEFVGGLVSTVESCTGDFTTKYIAFHKFATEFARDHRDLALVFNALLNEIIGTRSEGENLVRAVYEKFRLVIERMLEEGRRDGSVRDEIDPVIHSHIILSSHTGMLVQWFVAGEEMDVTIFTRKFRDFILSGIAKVNHG